MTRRLAREEGLLVGGSSGMAVVAALKAAEKLTADDVMVVLLPDGGRGYLGKIFSDKWMAATASSTPPPARPSATCCERRPARRRRSCTRTRTRPCATPSTSCASTACRQLPVLAAEPPVVLGEVRRLGRREDAARRRCSPARPSSADRVGEHIVGAPLPIDRLAASGASAARRAALGAADALLVHVDGKPAGVRHPPGRAGAPRWHRLERHHGQNDPLPAASTPAPSTPARTFDPTTGAVIPPMHLTTTFMQDGVGGLRGGYEYTPRRQPDARLAADAARRPRGRRATAFSFASGLAAEDTLLRAVLQPGDHVVLGNDVYGGTHRLVSRVFVPWGVELDHRST